MIAILIIVMFFYKQAVNAELNKVLWPILGVVAYFLFQVIFGFFIGIFTPSVLEDQLLVMLFGIIGGVIGVALVYWILRKEAAKVVEKKNNSDLLDKF